MDETTKTIDEAKMGAALEKFYSLHAEAKRLDEEAKKVKNEILAMLGDIKEYEANGYKATVVPTTRTTLNESELRKFYNIVAIDESCYKKTESSRFTVDKFVD